MTTIKKKLFWASVYSNKAKLQLLQIGRKQANFLFGNTYTVFQKCAANTHSTTKCMNVLKHNTWQKSAGNTEKDNMFPEDTSIEHMSCISFPFFSLSTYHNLNKAEMPKKIILKHIQWVDNNNISVVGLPVFVCVISSICLYFSMSPRVFSKWWICVFIFLCFIHLLYLPVNMIYFMCYESDDDPLSMYFL